MPGKVLKELRGAGKVFDYRNTGLLPANGLIIHPLIMVEHIPVIENVPGQEDFMTLARVLKTKGLSLQAATDREGNVALYNPLNRLCFQARGANQVSCGVEHMHDDPRAVDEEAVLCRRVAVAAGRAPVRDPAARREDHGRLEWPHPRAQARSYVAPARLGGRGLQRPQRSGAALRLGVRDEGRVLLQAQGPLRRRLNWRWRRAAGRSTQRGSTRRLATRAARSRR